MLRNLNSSCAVPYGSGKGGQEAGKKQNAGMGGQDREGVGKKGH